MGDSIPSKPDGSPQSMRNAQLRAGVFFFSWGSTRAAAPNDHDAARGLQHVSMRNMLAVADAPHSRVEAYSAEKRHPARVGVQRVEGGRHLDRTHLRRALVVTALQP